jgi:S-adenosylmethionine hydrolase
MITLSSDFGSPYPAAMKGVLLQHSEARLVDVAHDFPRQDVQATAFWLREVLPYFPPVVHLVVVDPGVGTDRDALVVRAGEHALVGPDNGVLLPVARRLGDPEVFTVGYEQRDPTGEADTTVGWPPNPDSATFHGRDVFAPAAAHVHECGVDAVHEDETLDPTDEYVDLTFPEATVGEEEAIGEVLAVDDFGYAITNVPGRVLADHWGDSVRVNGVWAATRQAYATVEEGHRVVTVGSHGNVELSVNQGRGEKAFGVDVGSRVRVNW